MITIDDFVKIQLKVGTVVSAEEIEGSDKLLKLKVDFGRKEPSRIEEAQTAVSEDGIRTLPVGEEDEIINNIQDNDPKEESNVVAESEETEIRQVLSGIKQWYTPGDLIGKQFVFCTNLAPRKMMGMESQAMIMAAEGEDKPIPLTVGTPVPNGAKIR